ncbi:hypothetical protein [Bradyrhizobium sp. USDA 4486]
MKERLLLIISAAGQPPDARLLGKSEVTVGFWTGDSFRHLEDGERPIVTHWARLADCLPPGVELAAQRRFGYDVRE